MRLDPYFRLMRLDRPVGTLLLLWPTLAALWLAAGGLPPLDLLAVFVAGTFLMRSAGCVINDIADRDFDAHVARTRARPLATGEVNLRSAIVLFVSLCLAAASLLVFLNDAARLLAVAGLGVAVLYPFLKRWTHLPQLGLSLAFSWGILMAFAAGSLNELDAPGADTLGAAAVLRVVPPQIPIAGWVLFAASAAWIVAYDTLYAMTDREDDIKIGVKSTAVLLGHRDRLVVGILQAGTWAGFAAVGYLYHFRGFYIVGLAVIIGLFAYQQAIIRGRDPAACFKAFLNNTWVGFTLFAAVVLEFSF